MKALGDLRSAVANWRWPRVAAQQSIIQGPTSIVDGELLRKLDRLSLSIGRDLLNGLMGEHQATRRTSGIEFADYRQYSPGDDLRRVDWNAYARLGTLHVRQSQAEHDTVLFLLVDRSPSMDFGNPSKFFAARRLAAALGYVALSHLDNVVLSAPGAMSHASGTPAASEGPTTTFKGRAEAASLFKSLDVLQPGEAATYDNLLRGWAARSGQVTATGESRFSFPTCSLTVTVMGCPSLSTRVTR